MSTSATAAAVALVLALAACGSDGEGSASAPTPTTSTTAATTTTTVPPRAAHAAAMVAATEAFLETLDPAQREAATYDATDPALRSGWSSLPDVVERSGVKLTDLAPAQRAAAMAVADAMLGEDGYEELVQIITADDRIAEAAGPQESWGGHRYYLAVYGTPASTSEWAVQLSGHHFARIMTFGPDGTASTTPAFTGTEPLSFELDGATVAPMADEVEAMFGMFEGLTPEQLAAADLGEVFADVLLGGERPGLAPTSRQGLAVRDLDERQRERVVDAMRQWVLDVDPAVGEDELASFVAQLDETFVAYSQSADPSVAGAYARIHGPRVWIELVAQPSLPFIVGGTVHYHSVYRDLTKDYGA